MTPKKPATDDLHDRLLDHALRETLGGEAPPDLSQQILSAASTPTGELLPLARGDEAMHGNHEKARKTRKFWVGLAMAASLLVAVGLILPQFQSVREAVRRSEIPSKNTEELKPSSGDTKVELPEFEIIPVESTVSVSDGGTVFVGGIKRLGDVRRKEKSDSLMMGVTPHIIIQEGEEERLTIKVHPIPELVLPVPHVSSSGSSPKIKSEQFGRPALERLSEPPRMANSQNENSALAQQLRRMQATTHGQGNAQQIRKLQKQYRAYQRTLDEEGRGPRASGDKYTRIYENPFITATGEKAVSTFSIDVDTASYANVRQFLMQSRTLPPPDAVRIEELVNYFQYDYSPPTDDTPFAAHVEVAGCPWQPEHRLVRIGIKGREVELKNRPQSNLVFLIDVSGSMNEQSKLPLLVEGLKMLTRKLNENDRVAIVVYASSEGLALESTRGDQQDTILAALEKLRAGGSTAGGAGIQLAYQVAEDHFIEGGTNRVILATDGDFNVGTTSTADLERLAESKAKETGVFLTVLGFGRGNLNDAMMEAISGKGNGNYHYIDNQKEARKVLVEEMTGTLMTIAKDVKIQIEFNPARVAGYRLLGYENRMLRTEDFNDDKKDAGEIGAGHTVTALYEVVPAGKSVDGAGVDPLKYQSTAAKPTSDEATSSDDLLTLKIRYKRPDGDTSTKLEFPITDAGQPFAEATGDFKFAAAVASFGMLLRDSEHRGNASFGAVLEIAEDGVGQDHRGYRAEFLKLVRQAKELREGE